MPVGIVPLQDPRAVCVLNFDEPLYQVPDGGGRDGGVEGQDPSRRSVAPAPLDNYPRSQHPETAVGECARTSGSQYIHTYIYIYIYRYIHTHIYIYIYIYVIFFFIYIYIYIYIYIELLGSQQLYQVPDGGAEGAEAGGSGRGALEVELLSRPPLASGLCGSGRGALEVGSGRRCSWNEVR